MHQNEDDDIEYNIRLLFSADYKVMSVIIESDEAIDMQGFRWVMKKLSTSNAIGEISDPTQ